MSKRDGPTLELVHDSVAGADLLAGKFSLHVALDDFALGRVYQAQDTEGAPVIAKFLDPRTSTDPDDPNCLKRLHEAARRAATIGNDVDGCVPILHVGLSDDTDEPHVLLVEEDVRLPRMRNRLSRGGMREPDAVFLIDRVAEIVQDAHSRGLLHLDLNPETVFVGSSQVFVSGFGLRGAFQAEVSEARPESGPFLAPEQRTGGEVFETTDVYALGRLLHAALKGLRNGAPAPSEIGGQLGRFIRRATRVEPGQRFPDIAAFRNALRDPLTMPDTVQDFELLDESPTEPGLRIPVPSMGSTPTESSKVRAIVVRVPSPSISEPAPHEAPPTKSGETSRRKLAIVAVLAFGAAALLCTGALVLQQQQPAAPSPAPATPVVEVPPVEAPAPLPVADVVPAKVTHELTSSPAGAEVLEDGVLLGVTPMPIALDADGGPRRLSLQLEGHTPREVLLRPEGGLGTVELAPIPKPAPRPRARPRPRPEPSPSPRPRGSSDDIILER